MERNREAWVGIGCQDVAGVGQNILGGYRTRKRHAVLRRVADADGTRAGATKRPKRTHTGWGEAVAWWLTLQWRVGKRRAMVARVSGGRERLMPWLLAGVRREEKRRATAARDRPALGHAWSGVGGASPPPLSPSQATRLCARKGTPPKPPLTHDPVDAAQADVRFARTRPGQKIGVGLGVAWEWIGGLCGRRLRRLARVISDAVLRSATSAPL